VGLGIESSSCNTSSSQEQNGSSDNNTNGPVRQYIENKDNGLLSSVGEVVVSGGHVVESNLFSRSLVHSDGSSIEVRSLGSIELHAVLNISLGIVGVVIVLLQQVSVGQAIIRVLI